MFELQGLQLQSREFANRNTEVVAIAVDSVAENADVAQNLALNYRVLSDPQLQAIDAYGLRHDDPGQEKPIAHPASFLIDGEGIVRWRDVTSNYRLRPRPETILAAIDRLSQADGR
jgi:peroxiredoxin Q/BCP